MVKTYSFIFTFYVIGTSIFTCVVCYTPPTLRMVTSLISSSFVEKFAQRKGRDNLLIIVSPFFILLAFLLVSFEYQMFFYRKESSRLSFLLRHLVESGQRKEADKIFEIILERFQNKQITNRIVSQFVKNPFMVYCHSLLSKVLTVFSDAPVVNPPEKQQET